MGYFPKNQGYISRAVAVVPSDTVNPLPAFRFENAGTLGNNLTGSVIYVGTAAAGSTIRVMTSGTTGLLGVVNGISALTAAGSGYVAGTGLATTMSRLSDNTITASGLTVDITVPVPTFNAAGLATGTGYAAGAVTAAGGIVGSITVAAGVPQVLTITDGGIGQSVGDVITILQGGSGNNATVTLTSAPNGVITAVAINNGGTDYATGDIITIVQGGNATDATFVVDSAVNALPTQAADAITFTGVIAGTVLPVMVDYVMATGTTASDLVAGK
jgi:hypothetical protein